MGTDSFKFVFTVIFLAFSTVALSTTALASISLNVSSTPVVQSSVVANIASSGIMITGSIVNTTPTDNVTFINVSANISNNFYSTLTLNNGSFSFNVTAPTVAGEYTLNVSTNSSSLPSKRFSIFVSNTSSGFIGFIGGKTPPFTNGTTFTINVTLNNGTSVLANYTPTVKIYQANGKNISWTVTNVGSTQTNNSGSIVYNITVPTDVSAGEYGISVDFGRAFTIFRVGSSYQMAVNTLTSSNEVAPSFTPGSTITILSKLRASGNPVTGATVTAVITYPNGTTTRNITLSAHPSSEGFYNNTFATESGVRGTYTVKVGALTSGSDVTSSTTFGTSTFTGRIEPVKNAFFFEWGGKSAFKPGESISLNLITVNLTSGDVLAWSSCTSSNYIFVSVTFVNGTNTTIGHGNITLATSQYLPNVNVCKVTFNAPTTSGTYNIKHNVTVGAENRTLDGFFTISNHFLKVTPVLDVGGFGGFESVFAPGSNITLTLKAINVSGNTETSNISSHTITKIVPLEFISGSSEVTSITQTSYNGVASVVDSNITFVLPSTILGPALIEVSATVNSSTGSSFVSETATGTTFIISNYLEGFLGPQKGGGLPSHEGESAGGFNADAQCSSTQTFSGIITDVNTSTAAQGATIIGIVQAREEETGKDISSFLSIAGTTSSDSSGSITTNITFSPGSGYSFSGNYFVIFNASYKGKTAGVPSFFMCRTLNMGFPQIKVIGSNQQFSWQVSPTSAMNVTLTNVANMSGTLINSTGTFSSMFSITQIFTFNPSTGTMQVLTNNTAMSVNFTTPIGVGVNANSASLTLYPQNYSLSGVNLTRWPNGFFDIRPRVVSNLGTDTGFGGFMVVAFDAFPEFTFGQSYAANSNQSVIVRAATNVSRFDVSMGRPWEGTLVNATIVSSERLGLDGWNNTNDTGNFMLYSQCPNPQNCAGPYERWNVTFTVPNTLKKGGSMLTIKVVSNATGNDGESVDTPLFVTVSKFNVVLPWEEGVGTPSSSQFDANYIIANGMYPASFSTQEAESGRNASTYGWNLAWINSTYGINSTSGKVCVKNTFNSTRYVQGGAQQNMPINSTGATRILVIDNTTAGTYDTVILNRSNETVILKTTSLATRSIGGQAYLWDIKECGYFTISNVSSGAITQGPNYISNNNGGSHQAGTNFTVPYVVVSGGARQNGVPVSIKSLAKQDNRGFGFEGKLTQAYYTKNGQYNTTDITTNSDGLAFVTLQVGTSGKLLAFWSTTIGSERDTADMSTATTVEIKGFSTSAQSVTPLTLGVVTLVNDTNNRTQLVTGSPIKWIFNGTVTETTDGDFVTNTIADPWSIVYDGTSNGTSTSNAILVVNTSNAYFLGGGYFNGVIGSLNSFYNTTITPAANVSGTVTSAGNTQLKIGEWNNGTSSNNYTKTVLFYTSASGSPNRYTVATATQNVTALICAEGFQKPNPVPVENATINVSVTDWSSFPPGTKYLDIFKLSDGSRGNQANPIVTSPAGCALVRIGPGQLGTWPSASAGKPPVFIEGTITKTDGSSEFVYIGDVFRP